MNRGPALRAVGAAIGALLIANAACSSDAAPDADAPSLAVADAGDLPRLAHEHALDAGADHAGRHGGIVSDADAAIDGPDAADAGDAALIPVGPLVVAMRETAEAPADLFLVPVDGGTPWALTHTPGRHELQPRWSPDHTKIAFLAVDAEAPRGGVAKLFVVDANGTNERELAADVSAAWAIHPHETYWAPTWSPTGDRVAYLHGLVPCPPPPNPDWYVADPCVTDLRDVRVADAVVEDPHLPPNEKWATEPIWLRTGPLLYVWTCFGEACSGAGPWLGNGEAPGRQLAFTRDARRFTLMSWTMDSDSFGWDSSKYPALEKPAPIGICSAGRLIPFRDYECVWFGPAVQGWSPRWSPREDTLVYLDETGVWTPTFDASPPRRIIATPWPAGVDW